MQKLNREKPCHFPTKFVQFGEGNFLRAFIDWQIDLLNERAGLDAGVVVVRPIPRDDYPLLDSQGGVYTTLIRGLNEEGVPVKDYRKITCIKREIDLAASFADYLELARDPDIRFIVSNTTEAGIATNETDRYTDTPPATFPAKLTRFLHERFVRFGGAIDKGVVLLPCELIDHNGIVLKAAVTHYARLWRTDEAFVRWIENACTFCSTLVDRIVTGYPREEIGEIQQELGYEDNFLVTAEYFYLLVIEGPASLAGELKLDKADLNIRLVDDITPYKQRKVGVLNGGHTTMVPVALLCGLESVRQSVEDEDVGRFLLETLDQEIIPALPLPREELQSFADDVLRRFRNPYIHHRLDSIALNSWSKYAARVLPQLLRYRELKGELPQRLIAALAATMHLYRGGIIALNDDQTNLDWFRDAWKSFDEKRLSYHEMAKGWLANVSLWKQDLNLIPGLTNAVTEALHSIDERGMRQTINSYR